MCRLLGYLGPPILVDSLLCKPEHSLIVQSYQPREMTSGVVNADGFGVGWYHTQRDADPFTYKNTLPIWSDINLPSLSRYVETGCLLGCVRSATSGQAVDLSNCQPFLSDRLLFVHNGLIKNFQKTLYRSIRSRLSDFAYQSINGSTDSEHIFALLVNELTTGSSLSLAEALGNTLKVLAELAKSPITPGGVAFSVNAIVTDGHQLVASRFASETALPSLYWLRDEPNFPKAVIIASEPLFAGNWHPCPAQSIIRVGGDLEIDIHPI